MDQCVRALSRDLGLVPSTHTQWLTLVYVRIKWPEFVFLKNIFKNIFILQPSRDASLRIKEAIFQWINPGNSSPQQEAQCPVPRAEREVKGTNTKLWGATVPEKWPNRPWHSLFSTKCSVWNQAMNKWSEDKLLFWGWATRGKTLGGNFTFTGWLFLGSCWHSAAP